MASIVRMPGISADSEEAVLLDWSVSVGAQIQSGDVLASVETEKANVDIESDQDGVLWRTLAEPGATVAVGAPIAILLAVGEASDDAAAILASLGLAPEGAASPVASPAAAASPPAVEVEAESEAAAPNAEVLVTEVDAEPARSAVGGRRFASPLARRVAREHNLSLADLDGTGPDGRIVRADVAAAIARADTAASAALALASESAPAIPAVAVVLVAPAAAVATSAAPAPVATPASTDAFTDIPHTGMRRAVARFLTQSKREAPHFYLTATCRVDELLALREQINATSAVRVSINDFVVKAVAKALALVPEMNVIWTDDAVRRFTSVDVCVAIGSSRGLVTPVIRSADTLSLTQISSQVRDFVSRANEGRLKQNELEGGTFTVTNLGMFGVENFSAIINPPQVGILAVGAVVERPVVVAGAIEVGRTLSVTMSVDHRPVDGVLAAQWLQHFTTLLEHPLQILA